MKWRFLLVDQPCDGHETTDVLSCGQVFDNLAPNPVADKHKMKFFLF